MGISIQAHINNFVRVIGSINIVGCVASKDHKGSRNSNANNYSNRSNCDLAIREMRLSLYMAYIDELTQYMVYDKPKDINDKFHVPNML